MFLARQSRACRSLAHSSLSTPSPIGSFVSRRSAHQDYGSGDQNPGTPNRAVHHEHPGPPPPKAAQQESSTSSSAQSSESGNKDSSGPKPRILNESPPAKGEEPEDVAKHNREVDQRADRAHEQVRNEDAEKDKVSKDFWSGTGGVDRQP